MIRLLTALGVVIGAVLIGSIISSIVRRRLEAPSRSDSIRQIAPAAASFFQWSIIALGLLFAVSMASPETLKPMPAKLVAFFPKVMVAAAFVLVSNVAAQLVSVAVRQASARATGQPNLSLVRAVRSIVQGAGILLAVSQIGINTTLVNLVLAGVISAGALSVGLLSGLGGREIAGHVAAGRYNNRLLGVGDHIEVGPAAATIVAGTVVAVRPATIEVLTAEGATLHIGHGRLLNEIVAIRRAGADGPATGMAGGDLPG